jgi:16S rRNA (guanine527-N7)-methyltransferase
VIEDLELPIQVQRGRAEENEVRRRWEGADVVTARAVAPLARLAGWALPLLRRGGRLVAVKGASAEQEVARDAVAVRKAGGGDATVVRCGEGLVEVPSTVVLVERTAAPRTARPGRRREQRS